MLLPSKKFTDVKNTFHCLVNLSPLFAYDNNSSTTGTISTSNRG